MVDTQLTRRTFLAGVAGGAAALTLGSCGDLARYWPPASGSWSSVSPADTGWDPVRLEAAVAFAGERSTQALLVLLDGRILAERRWGVAADFRRDVASCQKSVVALLVGQARSRGLLALGDAVSGHLGPGWSAAAPAGSRPDPAARRGRCRWPGSWPTRTCSSSGTPAAARNCGQPCG